MKRAILQITTISILIAFQACTDKWLSVKRELNIAVPATTADARALLNNAILRNDLLAMADLSADEYEIPEALLLFPSAKERNMYRWQPVIYEDQLNVPDWDEAYQQVFQCNVALETLSGANPSPTEKMSWKVCKGEALYYRAKAFFNLAQVFCPPYTPDNEVENRRQLGIPLRLSSDVNRKTIRSSLLETYDQIEQDLLVASQLVGVQPFSRYSPSRSAVFHALARFYLVVGKFPEAERYADSVLQLHPTLLDLNSLDSDAPYPMAPFNTEVLMQSGIAPLYAASIQSFGLVSEKYYVLYEEHDLRRTYWFRENANGTVAYRGNYTGEFRLFNGGTSAEALLIRGECKARAGDVSGALADLNNLLAHRYRKGHFIAKNSNDAQEVLRLILTERKKELYRRGIRWSDLRRLNMESDKQETLTRVIAGITYVLPPGDPRYVLPIPEYIIEQTGISQNERY